MTTTTTLFGGAVLVALIYFALRLAGVSNYWRGVISGGLPILGFIVYSMHHWPGGDGMTLHIALYAATAIALTLGGSKKKEGGGGKVHWVPMTIVGFFLVLAFLQAIFLTISTRGIPPALAQWVMPNAAHKVVYTAFSGEVPHDEEAAKTVSQYMHKTQRQRELAWQVEVSGLDHMQAAKPGEVTVRALDRLQQPLDNAKVQLSFMRPANAETVQVAELSPAGAGLYQGRIRMEQPGQWIAVLTIQRGPDSLETAKEVLIAAM